MTVWKGLSEKNSEFQSFKRMIFAYFYFFSTLILFPKTVLIFCNLNNKLLVTQKDSERKIKLNLLLTLRDIFVKGY
jgi:hypothetical protein